MQSEKPKFTNSKVKPYLDLVKGILIQALRDNKLDDRVLSVYAAYYWDLKELKDKEDS